MATDVKEVQDRVDQYLGDSSTDTLTANDRIRAITEAVRELYSELNPDFAIKTYEFSYYDTINLYDLSTDVPDFAIPTDMRNVTGNSFTRKSAREISDEVANGFEGSSFGIERKDRKNWLIISHTSEFLATTLHDCDSVTANGTWAVDSSGSDATNLTADTNEKKQGTASLNFDADVSQSGNNLATLENPDMTAHDLTNDEDLSSFIMWVYIPDVTNFTSVTVYWGSSSSAYWSATATTDAFGTAFSNGWNRIRVDWTDATKTSTPDVTAINYLRVDFNYTSSLIDETDFRIDEILMVRPQTLTLHYQTAYIGETNGGTALQEFTTTTDVPHYSGMYDFWDVYAAFRATAILFRQLQELDMAREYDGLAQRELNRLKGKFPDSSLGITKNFKINQLW